LLDNPDDLSNDLGLINDDGDENPALMLGLSNLSKLRRTTLAFYAKRHRRSRSR
jgi:hypothetical protein